MNPYTIVIPSKLYENQLACVDAIRKSGCRAPIIVVQDGGRRTLPPDLRLPMNKFDPLNWIAGEEPFVFARNANLGIAAAGGDVFLLNDDAIWESGSIDALARNAQVSTYCGLVAPALTGLVNHFQRRVTEGAGLRLVEEQYIPFVAVYVRRKVIEGMEDAKLLDERFVTYGGDDVDSCRRLRARGYSLAIDDGVVFNHGAIASTFRGRAPASAEMCEAGWKIYEDKWGDRRY